MTTTNKERQGGRQITVTTRQLRVAALALLAAVAPIALGSCMVESGSSIVIIQNQAPTVMGGGCVIPASRGDLRTGIGTFDVILDRSYPYFMYPLLESRLPSGLGVNSADPNRVDIQSWEVRIEPPPSITVEWSAACPAQYDFPSPLVIMPGEAASSIVEAMRPCHSDLLRSLFQQGKLASSFSERVIFRLIIRAKGRHGGTAIKSDPFEFPVRVCYGCLQTGFGDPAFADFSFPRVPPCRQLVTNPYQGNPCNAAQDFGPLLCCAKDVEGKDLECPGVPRAPRAP